MQRNMNKDIWSEIIKYLSTTVYIAKIYRKVMPKCYLLNKCYRDENEAKDEIIGTIKQIIYEKNEYESQQYCFNCLMDYSTYKDKDIGAIYFPKASSIEDFFNVYSAEEIMDICRKNYLADLIQDIMNISYEESRKIKKANIYFSWLGDYCIVLEKYPF